MTGAVVRSARAGDLPGACRVCLLTGNHGDDGEPLYRDDPDALGRIFVGPYLTLEPELSLVLEDAAGNLRVCARSVRLPRLLCAL